MNNVKPVFEGEDEFVRRKEDLVTLRPGRESAWLDAFVERLLRMIHCSPVEVSNTSILDSPSCGELMVNFGLSSTSFAPK